MPDSKDALASAMRSLSRGENVHASREWLENHLVDALMQSSLAAVKKTLEALSDFEFAEQDTQLGSDWLLLVAPAAGGRLVAELSRSEYAISASVSFEPGDAVTETVPDPGHAWFYAAWEALVASGFEERLEQLDEAKKAVALIALLESEIMNGGIGQYLANTGGQYVDDTLRCLARVGAKNTRRLLRRAAALRAPGQSYDDVWEEQSAVLADLDEAFEQTGEDLAALTASTYAA